MLLIRQAAKIKPTATVVHSFDAKVVAQHYTQENTRPQANCICASLTHAGYQAASVSTAKA